MRWIFSFPFFLAFFLSFFQTSTGNEILEGGQREGGVYVGSMYIVTYMIQAFFPSTFSFSSQLLVLYFNRR